MKYKIMFIVKISKCDNPLQWYSKSIGHMYLCHRSKRYDGFNTKILGATIFIPEKDTKVVTSVKVEGGNPFSKDCIMSALDMPYRISHGHNDLEAMLELVKPIHTSCMSKKWPHRQSSQASGDL